MSKTAIAGAVIMAALFLIGLFGNVTINGVIVENRIKAFFVAIVVIPLCILIFGFIFGFLKDALMAFFKESKVKLLKKHASVNSSSSNTHSE